MLVLTMVLVWETAKRAFVRGGGFPKTLGDGRRKDLVVELHGVVKEGLGVRQLSRDFTLKWRWTHADGTVEWKTVNMSIQPNKTARYDWFLMPDMLWVLVAVLFCFQWAADTSFFSFLGL